MTIFTFATRPSRLARWQTNHVAELLRAAHPGLITEKLVITTTGDRNLDQPLPEIGGKGLFTQELEEALREGRVDAAVHSLKDLPVDDAPGLAVGAVPQRARPNDALVCPAGQSLSELPPGARVGTSSLRRAAQLLALRPDLTVLPVRGNVDTRLRKAQEGEYDAILLAAAGLDRLGLNEHVTEWLALEAMLPAPGQGALAVQCRRDDTETLQLLAAIDHLPTRAAVEAERAFLQALGGGCSLPVGAFAEVQDGSLHLRGIVISLDGHHRIMVAGEGSDPLALGASLAAEALAQGAAEVLHV